MPVWVEKLRRTNRQPARTLTIQLCISEEMLNDADAEEFLLQQVRDTLRRERKTCAEDT